MTNWEQLVAFAKEHGYGIDDIVRWQASLQLESVREMDDSELIDLLMSDGPIVDAQSTESYVNEAVDELETQKEWLQGYFEDNDPIATEEEDE